MTNYVAGFLFDNKREIVALVKKRKFPPGANWSKNPFNAIGGKINEHETSFEAMQREFTEETGVSINGWQWFLTLCHENWKVYFYKAFSDDVFNVKTMEDEEIFLRNATDTNAVVPNLRWILPLALDESQQGTAMATEK